MMNLIKMNDGNIIPKTGFGTFLIPEGIEAEEAVYNALMSGYRLIDTAAAYGNEASVGRALKRSGLARKEVFITSKLWLQDYGYESAKKGIETSLERLGVDYIDLYLLHQPYGDVRGAWKALEEAKAEGKIRSIGISNFTVNILRDFLKNCNVLPAVNQVECNPFFQQKELRKYMEQYSIVTEAWYPLGHKDKVLLNDEQLKKIGEKYGKSVAQVILRWHYQSNIVALVKSLSIEHMEENTDIYNFSLTEEEMEVIASLDRGYGTHDPEDMGNEARLNQLRIHD